MIIIYHDSRFVIALCLQVTQNFDRRRWFFQARNTNEVGAFGRLKFEVPTADRATAPGMR